MATSVVVTGASSGLGLATSAKLAAMGYHVVLACRSVARGEAAAKKIQSSTPGASLEVLNLDLASLASVRSAASTLAAGGSRPPLHCLICNAGIHIVNGVQRSPDGYELTFATNHLGHFLLITLLLDRLAEPGRIVLVSSEVHQGPRKSTGFPAPRWDNPHVLADPDWQAMDTSAKAGRIRYATSKLANIYTTYELARRLGSRQITVNAFDPGLMPETRLDRDYPPFIQWIYGLLTPLLVRMLPGTRSVAQSGADLAWWATSFDVAGVSGIYCSGRRQRRSSNESYDQSRATELWEISEELVGAAS
jgi:protochlorophyllide reductase